MMTARLEFHGGPQLGNDYTRGNFLQVIPDDVFFLRDEWVSAMSHIEEWAIKLNTFASCVGGNGPVLIRDSSTTLNYQF